MNPDAADGAPVVLAARRISKSFSGVQVLFSVNFELRAGEIHALMGENGAGKSTLVKILSGFEQPTSGEILLDGQPVKLPPNGQAEALGIVIIHQEFNLAEHLTVTESLFLGREVTRYGVLDRTFMRAETRRVLDQLGSHVDEMAQISSLSIADKQMVEIARPSAATRASSSWTSRPPFSPARRPISSSARCASCATRARPSSSSRTSWTR